VVKDRASTEKAFTANTAYYRERRRYRSKVTASAVERNYKINGEVLIARTAGSLAAT
jgi:hypothetical protein